MVYHGYFNTVQKFSPVLRLDMHFRMQNACFSTLSFLTRIAQQFQNGGRLRPMECTECTGMFCFKNHMHTYPTMSREHSGKKLLASTEEILQNFASFGFQNHVVFKFRNFLFSVVMSLLWKIGRRTIGKPNCCLTSIKLS